ncbi:MAG: methylmalonyl Co-A mutase-associated GTPase MeaB [Rhodospirillales bacterium]
MNDRPAPPRRRTLTTADYVDGVRKGDRMVLARAITLVESRNPAHREQAAEVLSALTADAGKAQRVGITGVPGVGKSTFIDTLGSNLTAAGHRVAVLAVDPTSSRTGGSILGDKTRMARLAIDDRAFVRPSPSAGTLGGVTRRTRETMLLCEAAGYALALVETVGVGQSATAVADMVDFFLVLMIAGAGDELQGIKKGVLEVADMIAINKADGENERRARRAAGDYRSALNIMTPRTADWRPPVVVCSALANTGVEDLWSRIGDHREMMEASGALTRLRQRQNVRWMWDVIEDRLLDRFRSDDRVAAMLADLETAVESGNMPAGVAADRLIAGFLDD